MATIIGLTGDSFDESDVMPWKPMAEPYFWHDLGVTVIADRHLPDGTRQHMVQEQVAPGLVHANAQVLSSWVVPKHG